MNTRYNKYKWLQRAFSEPVGRINESYYFDRRDNEFFSVFITDYFLTDPTSTDIDPNNPYSDTELETLCKRIERLEQNDNSILSIPVLSIDDRKQMMQKFLNINPDIINPDRLQNLIEIEEGRSNLDFDNLLQDTKAEEWDQFKSSFIERMIDTFCNLQNINLDTVSLWTDKKMTSMTFDLDNNEKDPDNNTNDQVDTKETAPKQTKPWWKFW